MFAAKFFFLACSLSTLCNAANCYLPAGGEMNSTVTYQCPTNGKLSGSMCCRSMDPSGASGADICLKVGNEDGSWLCQNSDGSLWRRGCSDQSWTASGCVNVCRNTTLDPNGIEWASADEQLTPCGDGSYCCGASDVGTPCCQSGSGFFIVDGEQSSTEPSSSTGTIAATATITSSTSASHTSSSASSSSSSPGTNAGTIAGSVVGGFVGGAVVMALIAFYMFGRKARNAHHVAEMDGKHNTTSVDSKTGVDVHAYNAGNLPLEIGDAPRRHELGP